LGSLSYSIGGSLFRHGLSEPTFSHTVEKLRIAKTDPQHFGDNTPRLTFSDGTPAVPDPRFSYWDLLRYGLSGDGGLDGFRKRAGIDQSIDYSTLCGIVGLLLIEASVEALDSGDTFISASDAMEAANCVEEMLLDQSYRSIFKDIRKNLWSKGGRAAHRRTDQIKNKVISEWQSGRHKCPKDVYSWACKAFPDWKPKTGKQIVARWLRRVAPHSDDTELVE
jgi:hypothetical protein